MDAQEFIDSHGYYVSSCEEQDKEAEEQGILRPASEVQGFSDKEKENLKYFYVPISVKTREAFPYSLWIFAAPKGTILIEKTKVKSMIGWVEQEILELIEEIL